MKNIKAEGKKVQNKKKITRKSAITKIGLTGLAASSMMFLLNEPTMGQDNPNSPNIPPDWP